MGFADAWPSCAAPPTSVALPGGAPSLFRISDGYKSMQPEPQPEGRSKHLDLNELSVLDYPSSRGVVEYANTAAGQATGIFPTYMQVICYYIWP